MNVNDKIKIAAAILVFIVFISIARRLTKGMRERAAEKEEEKRQEKEVEKYETTTSADNPFNDKAFLNKAYTSKVIVKRFTDGGKSKAKELVGYFGRVNEDESKIIDFFRRLESQYQVAQISKSLRDAYKFGLLELLREGMPTVFFKVGSGLSTEDLNKIFKIVSNLPKYR